MKAHLGDHLEGPAGTADEVIITKHDRPDQTATVAAWFLCCPGQSPAWDKYVLQVLHLRPIKRQSQEPVITVPGATHEFILYAADPRTDPKAGDPATWVGLRPFNVVEQVELPDDNAARSLARQGARRIVEGVMPAEPMLSGQVEPWRSALIKSSAHLRGETHAP